ncbi:prenyltransferase [Haloquadratum walsbyi]|jgi:1,4-dihydroxy-2-naphthoate octaprenyltransferase|uniref:1,4-dihydroxy-2-naphthoate octaprenyltransferase n=1 Tax=Haloquadratum walsbyi J07HQW2 TaxID=1238425 RepID=U1NGC9_9EURY|nr:prenyltransferase [Haloquadratum walsbyi]ERG96185.1 MAG: 1,4-dihydroxy-2-naphthoate octaprenyltransferase [Haloquadratum walsbyi J07HQW2]
MAAVTQYIGQLRPLFSVARPPFLVLPATLITLGAAASAVGNGSFSATRTGIALIGLIALHVSVNALNEAADYESGIDERTDATPFSGGSKTLPAGDVNPTTVYRFGYATAAIGMIIGVWFLIVIGPILIPIYVIGAISVLGYTEYLTKVGLGEIGAGLGLGGLPVIGTALVQSGEISPVGVLAAVPAFILTFNLLLLNEFPDVDPDRYGGRANLIHRFGRVWGGRLYAVTTVVVPIIIILGVIAKVFPRTALLALLGVIAAFRPVVWSIQTPEERPPASVLRNNVIFILLTNILLTIGLTLPIILSGILT